MGGKPWTSGKHQATAGADRLGYCGHPPTRLTVERSLSAEPQAVRKALTLLRKTVFLYHFPIFTFTQGSLLAAFTVITEEQGWDLQDERGISLCALTLPWGWNLIVLRAQNRDSLLPSQALLLLKRHRCTQGPCPASHHSTLLVCRL